ncbi:prepilin-type N-terminal cleavage/methylation domain-containing protein [Vibrio sp. 1CM2L]|uniref:prepilin-type N-terminal cleavage/methylation domain-containing protein n=1 Tax=Vibrio sp. 1CM2L TaxID=2929166 RepID=UPI0020BF8AE2|nr:prepilin-type N-terminal cleavage/methylation domain-containing protein [Vibrio sp. 1CM2L]MCK8075115.1 prepilin-type N-terminal cleavage/methylation domain-containing protein [Vibrio sp. 1CM2L]
MKRLNGFSLLELVVVVVILGILSVVVAPKFLGLQSGARAAALKGLKGSMEGAAAIVYGKAAIEGVENLPVSSSQGTTVNGVQTDYGYPTASEMGIGIAVQGLSGENSDWKMLGAHAASVPNEVIVYSFDNAQPNETCVVIYRSNASAGAPTIFSSEADLC